MSFSAKLCNPTPYSVKIDYGMGQFLEIPPDGSVSLGVDQFRDFLPTAPGAADVQEMLAYHGVFLMNTTLSYDYQSLRAIRASIRAKEIQFNGYLINLQNLRAQSNMPNDENSLDQAMRLTGYDKLKEQIQKLKKREKVYAEATSGEEESGSVRRKLDPTRTIFVTQPPIEFPSVAAMQAFLGENPKVAQAHKKFLEESTRVVKKTGVEANING